MGNGVLNPLDKGKALDLIKDFVPVMQRFQVAVSLLFNEPRLRSLVERKGVTTQENIEPCDEVEGMRGLQLEGELGALGFTLCDPLLFLDPKRGPEDWTELVSVPLSCGPMLTLTGCVNSGDFALQMHYDVREAAWKLMVELHSLDPFAHENDPHLSEEDNAAYKRDVERLWEQFQRLEIPGDAYTQNSNGVLECTSIVEEEQVRTLIPIFYDICDAYFSYDCPGS
jgi:hypothetical protein